MNSQFRGTNIALIKKAVLIMKEERIVVLQVQNIALSFQQCLKGLTWLLVIQYNHHHHNHHNQSTTSIEGNLMVNTVSPNDVPPKS